MAACDKLYGTKKQYKEFRDWLAKKEPRYLVYMKERPSKELADGAEVTIAYSRAIQGWLQENCRFGWVKEQIKGNVGIQRAIGCGDNEGD